MERVGSRADSAFDGTAWAIALVVAVLFRYDFRFTALDQADFAVVAPVVVVAQWAFGYASGIYRGRSVTGSFDELLPLSGTVASVTALLVVIDLAVGDPRPVPLSAAVAAAPPRVAAHGRRSLDVASPDEPPPPPGVRRP